MKNKFFALLYFVFWLNIAFAQKPCNDFDCKLALARAALTAKPPQYQKALDLARGAESYDPSRKDKVYQFIQEVFNAIELKRKEAEDASIKAVKAETAANNAKAETKKALDKLKATANDAVTILVSEIDKDILQLNYDSTYDKCKTALKLEEQPDSVKKRVLEIAYFYTETDTLDAAVKTLQLLLINATANRNDLETAIKNANTQFFTFFENRYYPTMMPVEGGTFAFGKNDEDSISHDVTVKSFEIAKTETTVWQYFIYLKANHKKFYATPSWQYWGDNPIIYVNWYDAIEYCNWISIRKNKQKFYEIDSTQQDPNNKNSSDDVKWIVKPQSTNGFRLPTEPEWEFAARGGNKSLKYSGDSIINNVAWYDENSNSRTHSVKTKNANELGLHDMSGNVWEWCFDWYSDSLNISDEKLWVSPEKGSSRVYRGGSWVNTAGSCQVARRHGYFAPYRFNCVGFRVVSLSPQ